MRGFCPIFVKHMRPMVVTYVCSDYDSYLKIGPNQKEKGLDCRASRALFALWTTSIFETLIFIPRVRDWSVRMGTSTGHEECLRPGDKRLFLWEETQDEQLFVDNCCLLIWATFASIGRRHPLHQVQFSSLVTCIPENQLSNCIHALYKFGNPGYRHTSHMSI